MNVNQLKYFQAVCEEKSVTRAAERLHISQPSISNAIKCLEEELDVPLFVRDHKKLTIHPNGAFFLEKVNEILRHIDLLGDEVKAFDRHRQKILRIGISVISVSLFLQPFLSLQRQYPDIRFHFSDKTGPQISEELSSGKLDYGLIVLDQFDTGSFRFTHLTDIQIHFAHSGPSPSSQALSKSLSVGLIWKNDNPCLSDLDQLPGALACCFA